MARYAVREDLSYCRVDGRMVFLDLERDRYFQLPPALEDALWLHLRGATLPAHAARLLVAQNVLSRDQGVAPREPSPRVPAGRSATECGGPIPAVDACVLAEVAAIVLQTRWRLRHWPLRRLLATLDRGGRAAHFTTVPPSNERALRAAAAAFRRARLYVPVEMRCLLDSIALLRFLQRRRLTARLVFGVALDPFSAHCWVQAGDLVLNDSVGNVQAHTPLQAP